MKCNACWRELEGRAITTTCGHLLCPEDASKILGTDGACPICDQVLSKSHMKPVDINPNDEWTNMAMAGISPQILMKSAYKSVMFYIGQRDLETQGKMNKVVAQCRQKCEAMQEKFSEKLEQIYTAYQKASKRCQMMEQEIENLSKDKQELQEKYSEKCRQKRKLDEMYDQARNEIESLKRTAIQPANHFFSRPEPDLFSNAPTMPDNRDSTRKDWSVHTPGTPGPREDMWPTPARQNSSDFTFDISGGSPAKHSALPIDSGQRMHSGHPPFHAGSGAGGSNPSMTLRNLILSPIRRPQLSRSRPQLFTSDTELHTALATSSLYHIFVVRSVFLAVIYLLFLFVFQAVDRRDLLTVPSVNSVTFFHSVSKADFCRKSLRNCTCRLNGVCYKMIL